MQKQRQASDLGNSELLEYLYRNVQDFHHFVSNCEEVEEEKTSMFGRVEAFLGMMEELVQIYMDTSHAWEKGDNERFTSLLAN